MSTSKRLVNASSVGVPDQVVSKRTHSQEDSAASTPSTAFLLLKERIQAILAQNRQAENFVHYQSSEQHKLRLQRLVELAPELYDNPDVTPRQKWFSHARYYDNSQMPPFHIHFRYELQAVVKSLWQAWIHLSDEKVTEEANVIDTRKIVHTYVKRALRTFQSSSKT